MFEPHANRKVQSISRDFLYALHHERSRKINCSLINTHTKVYACIYVLVVSHCYILTLSCINTAPMKEEHITIKYQVSYLEICKYQSFAGEFS